MGSNPPTGRTYSDYVRFLAESNPCLASLGSFLATAPPRPKTTCSLGYIDYNAETLAATQFQYLPTDSVSSLVAVPADVCGRVVLVEDIDANTIETLGTLFDIDPLFFAGHVITDFGKLDEVARPPSLALFPSQLRCRGFLHIHTQKVYDIGEFDPQDKRKVQYNFKTAANVPRNVRRLPTAGKRERILAISRDCCSVMVKKLKLSWICIILVDPRIRIHHDNGPPVEIRNTLLHRGFEDFDAPNGYSSWASSQEPNKNVQSMRHSPMEILKHYFRQLPPNIKPPKVRPANLDCPSTLALSYYPIRISLGNWMTYTHLMSWCTKNYEIPSHTMAVNIDIQDLQRWRRRSRQSLHKLHFLAEFVQFWSAKDVEPEFWKPVADDVQFIRGEITHYSDQLAQAVPLATSMLQLLDSERAFSEATNVRRLTFIALIFIPLTFVSGIFSMSDSFLPGNSLFWVYFATSVPLVFIVLYISVVDPEKIVKKFKKNLANVRLKLESRNVAEVKSNGLMA